MTDRSTPPTALPGKDMPIDRDELLIEGGAAEAGRALHRSELDLLVGADPVDAPEIADRIASVLADRLEGPGRGRETD